MSDQTITKVSVDIYGSTYKMAGYESAGHMRLVATMVDDKMREIQSANPSLDTAKLAVLTAVNTMHDYLIVKEQMEQMEQELKEIKGGLHG